MKKKITKPIHMVFRNAFFLIVTTYINLLSFLFLGNKRYLPVFDNESEGGPPCKRMKRSSSKSENSELPEGN